MNGACRPPAGGDPALVRRAALRLGLQAAAATLVVLTLMIVVLGVLLARSTAAADDTRLTVTAGNADDVIDPPSGMWIVLREHGTITASPGLPTGLPLTAALDRAAAHAPPEDTTITLSGHDYRLRTQARSHPEAAQVQIVLDEAPAQQQQATLLRALCAAGLLGLLLTAAVGVGLGRRAVRPLETALAIQRRFVADAGHELRTPLTLLSTRAQLLRRNLPHHTTATHTTAAHALAPEIDAVVADARRLATILDDLLLAADPRPPTEHTIIDLATVMTSALDAARPGATEKGVTLTHTGPHPTAAAAAPTPVRGSAAGLHRAITAVVDNAVRHAATHVTATVHTHGRHTTIEIADDGPGIDPTLLPRVFERFATTNPEQPDTTRRYGIGLALVTDIIARHGGTVHARNRPEGGAVFTLNLPESPRERQRSAATLGTDQPAQTRCDPRTPMRGQHGVPPPRVQTVATSRHSRSHRAQLAAVVAHRTSHQRPSSTPSPAPTKKPPATTPSSSAASAGVGADTTAPVGSIHTVTRVPARSPCAALTKPVCSAPDRSFQAAGAMMGLPVAYCEGMVGASASSRATPGVRSAASPRPFSTKRSCTWRPIRQPATTTSKPAAVSAHATQSSMRSVIRRTRRVRVAI